MSIVIKHKFIFAIIVMFVVSFFVSLIFGENSCKVQNCHYVWGRSGNSYSSWQMWAKTLFTIFCGFMFLVFVDKQAEKQRLEDEGLSTEIKFSYRDPE